MTKKIKSTSLILLLTSFFLPFTVYLYTLCPTISVYADAGEYPTFAAISSFAHPPGFPLFILILKLFLLLPFENIAYKANLASAFFGALSVSLFYLLSKLIVKDRQAAFIAALILAFSQIFWKNSLVSEVFTLLAFFVILTFLLFYLWITTNQKKYFFWFLLATGFGLAHHQLILATLLPLFIWFLWDKKWHQLKLKDYVLAPLIISVGFLPYIYVFFAARKFPPMNWENPQTLNGLIRLLTRAGYGTFQLTASPSQTTLVSQISGITKMLLDSFSALGVFLFLVLFLVGSIKALALNRKIFFLSLFVIITVSCFFTLFSGMPIDQPSEIPYIERFQIIPSLYLALLISFGLLKLKEFLFQKLKKTQSLSLALFILPLVVLFTNFSSVNQRANYFGEYLGKDILSSVPKNSLFIFEGDAVINSIFYQRYALGKHQDIKYVVGNLLINIPQWYQEELKHFYPNFYLPSPLEKPQQYFSDFITLNSTNQKIILLTSSLENKLQLQFQKAPLGIVEEYLPQSEKQTIEEIEKQITSSFLQYQNPSLSKNYSKNQLESLLLRLYARPYIFLAQTNPQKTEEYYQIALKIAPYYSTLWLEAGEFYKAIGKKEEAIKAFKKVIEIETKGPLTQHAKENLIWIEMSSP